jgi:cell division protease FtsH
MRNGFVYLVVVVAVLAVLFMVFRQESGGSVVSYSEMLTSVRNEANGGTVPRLVISGNTVEHVTSTGIVRERVAIKSDTDVSDDLNALGLVVGQNVDVEYKQPGQFGSVLTILGSFLPILFIVGLLIFMMRQAQGSNNQAMSFGRSKARMISGHRPTVTFKDVQGVDEAKQELAEVVEFLKYPEKFTKIGARIPAGVLLIGPPGTGKTYLAKAVAGEAGVPFFSLSGSEFVEMFVGVGASRVRDLFEKARQNAPCLIFVDEIDAVGRQRGAGLGGSHDEREQTLNQILVEMDGFESETNVIVLAATNRPDILDPALLRPGRFDRQVTLDRPDIRGREAILRVHSEGKPLEEDVDLMVLAKETSGFSGADLANLLNEGAILAARANLSRISMKELEEAIDRVVAGPERKSRVISDKEKRITAFHEVGHALVGHFMGDMDPVHKISIIPRGQMGGYTRFLPPEDRSLMSQSQFEDQIATMMGGRAAELMVFDEVTTGASSDLERSTDTARQMVTRYGMSRKLGPRTFGKTEQMVFLGRDIAENRNYSEAIAEQIDDEVTEIIMRAHERATEVLRGHRDDLDRVSEYLLEHESMDVPALEALLRGEDPPEPLSGPPEPEPEPEDQPPEPESQDRPPAGRRIAEEPGGAA